ncbi:MAG TPA: SMR family transporter [Terriglobales bacterium]|jgi:undecaprenyl phosphate-alpha-L-ara4N flippase subunit ArnE
MNPKLMIWSSVALSAVAQIFLKHGLTKFQARRRSGSSNLVAIASGILRQGFIWMWGMCFVAALALWLVGLRKLDLSYAYPLVSLGYVLVSVLSAVFFHERVDRHRWIAVAVISLGVGLIAGS